MNKFIDLTGKIIGRLEVLHQTESRYVKSSSKAKIRKRYWLCRCSCGKEKEIRGDSLLSKKSPIISCGCFQKEKARENGRLGALPFGEKPFNDLLSKYKVSARMRGIHFCLTKNFFKKIVTQNCHYCGVEPKQIIKSKSGSYFIYNGVDRLNPLLPYEESNVVPCCGHCNYAKLNLKKEEFLDLIKKIYNNHFNEIGEYRIN